MNDMFSRPELDVKLEGWFIGSVPIGITEHTKDFGFDCLFNGVELQSSVNKLGSTITFYTEYYAPPLSAWLRYKKFGKAVNLFIGATDRFIFFPSEPRVGVRIKIIVDNQNTTSIDLAINLFQFTDIEIVDTSTTAQGEDW